MLGKQLCYVEFNFNRLFPAETKLTERTNVGLACTHMLLWQRPKWLTYKLEAVLAP